MGGLSRALWGRGLVPALITCAAACTDVELHQVDPVDDKVAVSGEFCTPAPVDTVHEVDVLFLVDSSPSLRWNDPNDLLVASMNQVTQKYLANGGGKNIKFAVVRFGLQQYVLENLDYAATDYPGVASPPRFTNDPAELQRIFARMSAPVCTQVNPPVPSNCNPLKYLDGTNYLLGLQQAKLYIDADLVTNPANVVNSRYIIEFVTDGMPQSTSNDPTATAQAIVGAVADLRRSDDVRTDVDLIAENVVVPPEFVDLLPQMASTGGGTYTQLNTPGDLQSAFDSALSSDTRRLVEYELANYFVYNRNVRLMTYAGQLGVWTDSDGDGLIDAYEKDQGMNPQACDTSGDGLSDWFKDHLRGEFDPLAKNMGDRGPDGDLDPDGDGLTNFEEAHLGTNPKQADTDNDGVPDDIELFLGTDPASSDLQGDPDVDEVPNGVEVTAHTDPLTKEADDVRSKYAYVTSPVALPNQYSNGVRCYAFRVENITLARTSDSVDCQGRTHPAGMNNLEVIVIAKPVVDTSVDPALANVPSTLLPNQQLRAHPWIIYDGMGHRDPDAVELNVQPSDFAP